MSETTAEERAAEGVNALLIKVERLEKERDSLKAQVQEWMEGLAQLQVKLEEAVGRVETYHGAEIFAEQKAGHDTHDLQGCDVCRFLAGLSTITPDCERVSDCCDLPAHTDCSKGRDEHEGFRCTYHGCPWPDGEKECPVAMAGNVTT